MGDTGLGSNIDLTKISLSNIERIEFVKGSMGLEYGNGAVAGVINIITKKNNIKKINIRGFLQEETVRDFYYIRKKGNGRQIQNLNVDYSINNKWFAYVNFNHNQFMGYEGKKHGYKYFRQDNKRGNEWNPKDQYDVTGLIKYSNNKTSFFYKLSYLTEKFNFYNPEVIRNPINNGLGGITYESIDREYNTTRWLHQFNIQTNLSHIRYMGDFSYQSQDRKYFDYIYDIPNKTINNKQDKRSYYKTEVIYSRGMFSNFIDNKIFDFRMGYELDYTDGYAALIAGSFGGEAIKRKIFTYSHFISAEWNISDKFSIRPGVRLSVSENFNNQYNYSFSAKLKTSKNSNLRTVLGSSNRFPKYGELYTYFVNINHDIQGNPDLDPEKGFSAGVFGNQNFITGTGWEINYNVDALYLDVKDRIEMVIVKQPSTYRYININRYKNVLLSANINFKKEQFALSLRGSLNGTSVSMNNLTSSAPKDFQYHTQAGASVTYKLKNTNTNFVLYYKYTGPDRRYISDTAGKFYLGRTDDFHMMDFTVSQPFCNNHLEISVGVKNLFDVTRINSTAMVSSAHTSASGFINLYYGRSYFARLIFLF